MIHFAFVTKNIPELQELKGGSYENIKKQISTLSSSCSTEP